MRAEIAALRASRERLVLAADAERRSIERELHGGLQQHLVALAVRLQLAESALDTDPAAAKALLDEMSRDVQEATEEASRLAHRTYVPLLELGLAAALRSAAVSVGVPGTVEVSADSSHPPEILQTVHTCWVDALAHAGDPPPAIGVREEDSALIVEVVRDTRPESRLDAFRDRVEALGGTLTVQPDPDGAVRVTASLPLSR